MAGTHLRGRMSARPWRLFATLGTLLALTSGPAFAAPTTAERLKALEATSVSLDRRLQALEHGPVVTPPVVVPPVVVPPAPPPAITAKPLVSALPAGVGAQVFDQIFTDQKQMAWNAVYNPTAPLKRAYYFGTQFAVSKWEDAGSRQGGNDLQIYTDAYYPTQYVAGRPGVLEAPGTRDGIETIRIVGGKARFSLLANPSTTNPQLFQYYGGHPTPSGVAVKRLGPMATTENSFAQSYGYFVARINVDALTAGAWPAFWLLPTPATMGLSAEWKELDAYEGMSSNPKRMFTTYHGGDGLSIWPDILTPGFHDIGILVTPTTISTWLDGKVVPGSTKANRFPPGVRWYMLLNVAAGGWDGQQTMEAPALPAYMDVEYLKAFALAA